MTSTRLLPRLPLKVRRVVAALSSLLVMGTAACNNKQDTSFRSYQPAGPTPINICPVSKQPGFLAMTELDHNAEVTSEGFHVSEFVFPPCPGSQKEEAVHDGKLWADKEASYWVGFEVDDTGQYVRAAARSDDGVRDEINSMAFYIDVNGVPVGPHDYLTGYETPWYACDELPRGMTNLRVEASAVNGVNMKAESAVHILTDGRCTLSAF